MGFNAPFINLEGFFTNRPPLLVFTLCLTAFSFATFTLGIFIQRTENIPNPGIRSDWNRFLSHLSQFELCAVTNKEAEANKVNLVEQIETAPPDKNIVPITVPATVKLVEELTKLPNEVIGLSGTLQLGAWAKVCYNGESTEISSVNVTFVIYKNLTQSTPQEACVILSGPSTLLPFNKQSSVCVPPVDNTTTVGQLTGEDTTLSVINLGAKTRRFCENGSVLTLEYQPKLHDVIMLSVQERAIIKLHLYHTSFFLLCMSLAFGLFALFKGRYRTKVFMVDEVPLNQA